MFRLDAPEMLARLVGFPTVVGQPNGDLIAFIAEYLEGHGARVHVLPGPVGMSTQRPTASLLSLITTATLPTSTISKNSARTTMTMPTSSMHSPSSLRR